MPADIRSRAPQTGDITRMEMDFDKGKFYGNSSGDVWTATWADDGYLYTLSDDSHAFSVKEKDSANCNLAVSRLAGNDPFDLAGKTVNTMVEYQKAGGAYPDPEGSGYNWKGSGLTCIDGVLYLIVGRHNYWHCKNPVDKRFRQTAANASIIKSLDHGKTWTRPAIDNYNSPLFPGSRFGAPFFIEYGKNGRANVHGADKYVYAISNNGFWDNGDEMILGRCLRTRIADLNGEDWEYCRGQDGMDSANWSHEQGAAAPILSDPYRLSMTAVTYVEPLKRYVMIQWYYTNPTATFGTDFDNSVFDYYQSPTPWGPWTKVSSQTTTGYYNPMIVPKFISADGKRGIVFVNSRQRYCLNVVPMDITVAP